MVVQENTIRRILARVRYPENGCWEWVGGDNGNGYGRISVDDRHQYTHRLTYQFYVGPIPDGLQIDHLCRNRRCCNPAHLEPVTPQENSRRGDCGAHYGSRTHCGYGHALTSENVYLHPTGARVCKECRKSHSRSYRQRLKQQAVAA